MYANIVRHRAHYRGKIVLYRSYSFLGVPPTFRFHRHLTETKVWVIIKYKAFLGLPGKGIVL